MEVCLELEEFMVQIQFPLAHSVKMLASTILRYKYLTFSLVPLHNLGGFKILLHHNRCAYMQNKSIRVVSIRHQLQRLYRIGVSLDQTFAVADANERYGSHPSASDRTIYGYWFIK